MSLVDLVKATVVCGLIAFVVYSFPVVVQGAIIGVLGLAWLSYVHKTLKTLLDKRSA